MVIRGIWEYYEYVEYFSLCRYKDGYKDLEDIYNIEMGVLCGIKIGWGREERKEEKEGGREGRERGRGGEEGGSK